LRSIYSAEPSPAKAHLGFYGELPDRCYEEPA